MKLKELVAELRRRRVVRVAVAYLLGSWVVIQVATTVFPELELPAWAADFDCASWAQFFLKFILGHPAVTCPIPATSKARHLVDNMSAGHGRLPDEAMRQKMIEYIGT